MGRALLHETTPLTLEVATDLPSLREEWPAVAAASGNPFATWEWTSIWWTVFGRDRPLRITACRDKAGRLVGILPLYLSTARPAKVLRFLGHGPGDRLGPICHESDRPAVARALRQALDEQGSDWDVFLAERLPGEHDWEGEIGGTRINREACPVVANPSDGWEGFLRSRSSNFREKVRQRERKLAREHDVNFRLADDPARLGQDLNTLIRLHDARWRGAGALSDRREAFHRAFAAAALSCGWLRLWLLELDGRTVGASYGFRFGDAEWGYQSGRDPEWERSSIGIVLLQHSIRAAFEDGVREYHLLRGAESYKRRFADHDPGLDTIAVACGLRGRAAVAASQLAKRLPQEARRRFKRAAGDDPRGRPPQ